MLAALLGIAGCGRAAHHPAVPPRNASPRPPVRIVALGDSLALGTGASSPSRGFIFRAYLRVRDAYPGSRVDTFAMGGSTAADVLRLQVPRLASERADIIVVCVGGNDVVRRVDAADFAATYRRIAQGARALQPHAAIVLCGVPDVGSSPLFTGIDHDSITARSRDDDRAVRAVARQTGATFVDLYATTSRSDRDAARFLSDDRFHPSDVGYAALARALTPALLHAAAARPRT